MVNTRSIWYLEKSRTPDKSQCGFRKYRGTISQMVILKRYLCDAFAKRQQAVGLFFDFKPMRQAGNMVSSETITVFTWKADCLFLGQNISGTTNSGSESGQHSLMNSIHRMVLQLVVSWLWHALDWRLMSYPLARPGHLQSTLCWPGDLFSWSLTGHHRQLQQAVNVTQESVTRNGFRFAAHTCKVVHLTAPWSQARSLPTVRIGNTLLPVEDSTKFLGLWWDSYLAFIKHNSVLKTEVPRGPKPHLSGRSLEVGRGQRHTSDAVLGHCSLQAGLWLHCAWHNEHQSATTGQRA